MKNLNTQIISKLAMRNTYGAQKTNQYDNENMPGRDGASTPTKKQL